MIRLLRRLTLQLRASRVRPSRCSSVDSKAPARPGLSLFSVQAGRGAYAIRALPDLCLGIRSERLGGLVVVTGNFLREHRDPAPQGGIINSHERSDQP